MRLYARPQVAAVQWSKDVSRFWSEQAREAYTDIDPRQIPAHRVTGSKVVPTDSAKLARIHVMTDAGTYLIILVRDATDREWKVERVVVPDPEVG